MSENKPTKTVYALFRTRYGFVASLASMEDDANFVRYYEGVKLIEKYESDSWEEASKVLVEKMDKYIKEIEAANEV